MGTMHKLLSILALLSFSLLASAACYSKCKECVQDDNQYACISCADSSDYLYVHNKGLTGQCKASSSCTSVGGTLSATTSQCLLNSDCDSGGCTCHVNCTSCTKGVTTECLTCPSNRLLLTTWGGTSGKCILWSDCLNSNLISPTAGKCYTDSCSTGCPACTDTKCLTCATSSVCTACIDSSMYVSDGVCILESACTSRKLVLAKTCYMNSKCPAGYNETGSECRACHSSCDSTLGCKVPGQRNSCYGCPSGQYLLKKLASDIGTCINATDCVTPYYRGTTTTNCYSDSCGSGDTCYQCDASCNGCSASKSASACTACADSTNYILNLTASTDTSGTCILKTKCTTLCCRNTVSNKCYLTTSTVACATGYFICDSTCNGCTATGSAACTACSSSSAYLSDPTGTSGSCVAASGCTYLSGDAMLCITTKTSGMWCNTTTNKCYTCDSNCATCAGSSDSAKCTSCADSGKYVLATSSRRYGPCITKKLCVVPRYRDDSNKMCYTDTCPADASCQQCSVPCDGCFESNSVTSCVNCSLSTEIMSSETGKCIKSTACIYSAYRDDTLKVCYQSKCPTGSTHCFLCDSTCAGCTAERSAYNCLGCSDSSKYLMLYPDSVDGMCVELAHCPPYRDELNKKCYVSSCPTNSTTCFQCDDTCSTCTSSRNTTACKGCSDSSMYLSKSTINSVVGTCLTKTGAASLTSAFVDATNMFIYSDGKCPTGTFRNVTSKQCLSCSSDCGVKGCTVSGGADKCNDCSDSTKYLFIDLKLNASSGPCIPEAACAIPYLKDPSSKTCYNSNTCPDGMYLEPTNYYCYRVCPSVYDADTTKMTCTLENSGAATLVMSLPLVAIAVIIAILL